MKITKTQFDILAYLEKEPDQKNFTQRNLARLTSLSLGTVNKALLYLTEIGLIKKNTLTKEGLKALEPFRVKRAIFLAAGFGSRLVPITLNTPKPLVRVKGVRIIDTLLDAVIAAGIEEIIIIRGYLGEQFDQLKYKYPKIKFLENPIYNESNNISSTMVVRYMLQNSYVMDSDLLLSTPGLVTKYQYTSNILGVPVERTDDWFLETRNGFISRVGVGGHNCYQMYGISYWNASDGAKLAEHIKKVYEMPGGKERYWEQVPFEYFVKEYSVEVRECTFKDITEIDTFNELKSLDDTYKI